MVLFVLLALDCAGYFYQRTIPGVPAAVIALVLAIVALRPHDRGAGIGAAWPWGGRMSLVTLILILLVVLLILGVAGRV